jgi:hypothetical protein
MTWVLPAAAAAGAAVGWAVGAAVGAAGATVGAGAVVGFGAGAVVGAGAGAVVGGTGVLAGAAWLHAARTPTAVVPIRVMNLRRDRLYWDSFTGRYLRMPPHMCHMT